MLVSGHPTQDSPASKDIFLHETIEEGSILLLCPLSHHRKKTDVATEGFCSTLQCGIGIAILDSLENGIILEVGDFLPGVIVTRIIG